LLARADADGSAVRAFLATADLHRSEFVRRRESASGTPWPYALLEWVPEQAAPEVVRRVLWVVRENVAWLRQVIAERGWPGRSLVGEDGVDAAWLILQHAGSGVASIGTPENLEFQSSCVPLLRQAVEAGEAHPRHLAHIVDNLRMRAGRSPEYAVLASAFTAENGRVSLTSDLDPIAIDEKRREIGLAELAVDLELRRLGQPPGPTRDERPERAELGGQ
jgi:hypothetical protein